MHLDDRGHPGGPKLAEAMARALVRLNDDLLDHLFAYWAAPPYSGPRIEIDRLEPGTLGFCWDAGHAMTFAPHAVAQMPSGVLFDLAGHEIVHCLQNCLGHTRDLRTPAALEIDADLWAKQLGFSPYSVDDWCAGPRPADYWVNWHLRPGGRYALAGMRIAI